MHQTLEVVRVQNVVQASLQILVTHLEVLNANRVAPTLIPQNLVLLTLAIKIAGRVTGENTPNALLVTLFRELQHAVLIKNFAFWMPNTVG